MPIASGTEILWRGYFKFKIFFATSRFHCHRSKADANGNNIFKILRKGLLLAAQYDFNLKLNRDCARSFSDGATSGKVQKDTPILDEDRNSKGVLGSIC